MCSRFFPVCSVLRVMFLFIVFAFLGQLGYTNSQAGPLRRDQAVSDCGVPLPPEGLIISGSTEQQGYPWSASVFRQNRSGPWILACLGTLITPRLVITGISCVVDSKQWSGLARVGLGVYKKNDYAVILEVDEHTIYRSHEESMPQVGLGLLLLAEKVKVTSRIMPACVDWTNSIRIAEEDPAYIFAWSTTGTLLTDKTSYIDGPVCRKQDLLPEVYLASLQKDMFCVVKGKKGESISPESYGAGLTFILNNKHYLTGVLTIANGALFEVNGYTDVTNPANMNWLNQERNRLDRPSITNQGCSGYNCFPQKNPVAANPVSISKSCSVPDLVENMIFSKYNCRDNRCNKKSGDIVPNGELIIVSCTTGDSSASSVVSRVIVSCQEGSWDPVLPQCHKLCPALTSLTVEFNCWQGPTLVSCDKPMSPDTVAVYKCKEYHDSNDRSDRMRCGADGTWSRPNMPYCIPKCGISNMNAAPAQAAIFGGKESEPGNFPWHAALYLRTSDTWEAKCGGTLISSRHILTAAHCVTTPCEVCKPHKRRVEDILVGLGKHSRKWGTTEGIIKQINAIHIHPEYYGKSLNYVNDIALVVLKSDVAVNTYILPACVEYSESHLERSRPRRNQQGFVAGWGNTEECSTLGGVCDSPSEKLMFAKTTIIDFEQCFNVTQTIKPFFISRLTPDKFCAGNGSVSVVQQGDSGGGLTFEFDGLHHIYGVVSIKLKMQVNDKTFYNFGAFTNVSYHLEWLNALRY